MIDADIATIRDAVRGAIEVEVDHRGVTPLRLPAEDLRRTHDSALERSARSTSGVRLAVATDARVIEVAASVTRVVPERLVPDGRPAVFVATIDGRPVAEATALDAAVMVVSPSGVAIAPPPTVSILPFVMPPGSEERTVEIWFPPGAFVTVRGVSADTPVRPAPSDRPSWIHYGSSISHASDMPSPLDPWPVRAALDLDLELTSLGLGGQAQIDPFAARVIRDRPFDLISLKLGINVVNGDSMRERVFRPALHGFLDTVRDGHPTTPVVLMTPISCSMHEEQPGPTLTLESGELVATDRGLKTGQGWLTLSRIRDLVAEAVADRDDPHLRLIDGRDLLGPEEEHLLYDRLHPNAAGHAFIAGRVTERLRIIRGSAL